MPPKKFRSGRETKRRFTGNKFTMKKNKVENEASVEQESAEETEDSESQETTWCLSVDDFQFQ